MKKVVILGAGGHAHVIADIITACGDKAEAFLDDNISFERVSGAIIGKHAIINTAAVVEHDDVIDDYVHISVGAKIGGTVHVGESTWVGIGATVNNNINICGGSIIGAGAVVVKDVKMKGTYIGIPAKMCGGLQFHCNRGIVLCHLGCMKEAA